MSEQWRGFASRPICAMSGMCRSQAVAGKETDETMDAFHNMGLRDGWMQAGQRRFGRVNWVGLLTLAQREVYRFWKVGMQTLAAPMVTTLLFFTIFTLAFGARRPEVGGVPFPEFLAPGLIMMALMQNAFANSSSSLMIAKLQGNIVDTLMAPLHPWELNAGFAIGGVVRGFVVALGIYAALVYFVPMRPQHIWVILYYAFFSSLLLTLIGTIAGMWAEKVDHAQSIVNFVIMPLSFLSGTFYSVQQLPPLAQTISYYNPFFYMIDGFRYGFTGQAESNLAVGMTLLFGLSAALWWVSLRLWQSGWRLKA